MSKSPAEWETMQNCARAESGANSSDRREWCILQKKVQSRAGTFFLYTLSWYAPRTGTVYEYSFTIEIYLHTDILYTYCLMSTLLTQKHSSFRKKELINRLILLKSIIRTKNTFEKY